MKPLNEYSEKIQQAIKWITIDEKYSFLEKNALHKLAEEENVFFEELELLVKENLHKKCPLCKEDRTKNQMRCEKCNYIFNDFYRRAFNIAEFATPVIHLLGLIAIILAVIDLSEIKDLSHRTNVIASSTDSLSKRTEKIVKQMKTTHLNDFPDNIGNIIGIISQAKDSLKIAVDVPAYGIFSRPDMAEEYMRTITKCTESKKDFKLRMIIFNDTLRREKLYQQFHLSDDSLSVTFFNKFLKSNPDFEKKFKNYVTYFEDTALTNAPTFSKLWRSIEEKHTAFIKRLSIGHPERIHQVTCELTTYFWIVDNQQTAFSFVSLGTHFSECTFKSEDDDLINTLEEASQQLMLEK